MPFTEFYCNASIGSNMNGGSDENSSPSYSATNGGWNSGTGVFTPASGNPSLSVTVGQFAHVFTDGSTTPTFIGRVTAVNSTTITISTTAKSGTAPTTAGTGISINVGGVWKGPNGAVGHPFGFITSTLADASSNSPRVNFKNNATYSITAGLSHGNTQTWFQGYSTTLGDLGRAIIDGGTSGASYVLLSTGLTVTVVDFIFQNNGASGSASGVGGPSFLRCVVNNVRGTGFAAGTGSYIEECEAYACNQSNSANLAGFTWSDRAASFSRCISHDNTGGNNAGFLANNVNGGILVNCIADSNGGIGFSITGANAAGHLINCDAYNNGSHGLLMGSSSANTAIEVINSNFIKNGGYGVTYGTTGPITGRLINCGFGSGTQANTSGATNLPSSVPLINTITYSSDITPWVDPANGDFRINLALAKGSGRGSFTQTAPSYSGTIGYPDIGAAQHLENAVVIFTRKSGTLMRM